MEKTPFVDQDAAARFERVGSRVAAHSRRLATHGSVVAGWRTYRGRRPGPDFRLAYRDRGRQRSIYLARLERRHRERRLFACGWRLRIMLAFASAE